MRSISVIVVRRGEPVGSPYQFIPEYATQNVVVEQEQLYVSLLSYY